MLRGLNFLGTQCIVGLGYKYIGLPTFSVHDV